jgi:hypothetical protein
VVFQGHLGNLGCQPHAARGPSRSGAILVFVQVSSITPGLRLNSVLITFPLRPRTSYVGAIAFAGDHAFSKYQVLSMNEMSH